MDWAHLFCNGCEGAYGNPPNGLMGAWIFLQGLLGWDIVKGLIVFMLAMAAGGEVIHTIVGAVSGMSARSQRVVTHAAYPGAPSGDGKAQKSSVPTDLDQPLSNGEWDAIMEDD
jgi:hypothetical protein